MIIPHIPKIHRTTIVNRISNIFLDIIETSYNAYYTTGTTKIEKITYIMTRLDSMKFLILISWENKLIQNKQYENLAKELHEIGMMLNGWKKSSEAKLSQTKTRPI